MTLTPLLAELSGNLHVGLAALGAAVGVGFIGIFLPELTTEAVPFVFYLGGKVALGL